jgi:hypothetical protein
MRLVAGKSVLGMIMKSLDNSHGKERNSKRLLKEPEYEKSVYVFWTAQL